jgi:hypothetical protein
MCERMILVFLPENLEISPSETNVSGQHWSRLLRKAHNAQVLIKNSHTRPILECGRSVPGTGQVLPEEHVPRHQWRYDITRLGTMVIELKRHQRYRRS